MNVLCFCGRCFVSSLKSRNPKTLCPFKKRDCQGMIPFCDDDEHLTIFFVDIDEWDVHLAVKVYDFVCDMDLSLCKDDDINQYQMIRIQAFQATCRTKAKEILSYFNDHIIDILCVNSSQTFTHFFNLSDDNGNTILHHFSKHSSSAYLLHNILK